MQASDEVGPKILFDFSQVEAGYPVLNLLLDLKDQGWKLHPDTLLPKSDSGKITIQGWKTPPAAFPPGRALVDNAARLSTLRITRPPDGIRQGACKISTKLEHKSSAWVLKAAAVQATPIAPSGGRVNWSSDSGHQLRFHEASRSIATGDL
jgi:hypothetical protein